MQYNVIIKGTRWEAARAAADRGIPLVFVRESCGQTHGLANSTVDELNKWICEAQHHAPFPAGTLLLWTPRA